MRTLSTLSVFVPFFFGSGFLLESVMLRAWTAFLWLTGLSFVWCMPYRVPLQGREGGKRTLVLLDDLAKVHDSSIFFSNLAHAGHDLSYFQSTSPELKLKKYGVHQYDNIIMFGVEEFNTITFQSIIDFVDDGGNVLVAVDGKVGDGMRSFAEQCGIDFDRKGSVVTDHFSFDATLDSR